MKKDTNFLFQDLDDLQKSGTVVDTRLSLSRRHIKQSSVNLVTKLSSSPHPIGIEKRVKMFTNALSVIKPLKSRRLFKQTSSGSYIKTSF